MANKDKSRSIFNPRKHYTGLQLQQGRVVTDFDSVDADLIAATERQRAQVDIIGSYGSADDGYRVTNARIVENGLDFDMLAGTLYLGGLRLELEAPTTFLLQPDLLQLNSPPSPDANQPNRRDLVMLEAYEAPVTAVEDGELLDPALGGADTAIRMRRFARVFVIPGVSATDCDGAWTQIKNEIEKAGLGVIDANCQRVVDTRMTVTYTTDGVDDDLCDPPRAGGYLGAENQAIRVQLVNSDTFTWGFNNASPAYRVSLSADRTRVTLITPPRDEYSLPVVGQVIEILPWGAILPNGEKTAGLSGHLTRITAVDPSDVTQNGAVTVTLANAVPNSGFEDWRDRADAALMGQNGVYYFMHIWDRGSDVGSAPKIPFMVGTPVTLGTTGIQVTFTGNDAAPDDAWVIGARPETPNRVLPWGLETGEAPLAVKRYYAPLALIKWGVGVNQTAKILDCRPHFRPLTAQNECCTLRVGDGKTSDGDFNDLALALDNLPDNAEICLLPGVHRADVRLIGRKNITISGCGKRSKVIPVEGKGGAVITIQDCLGISLYNFDVISADGTGIAAENVSGLHIEHIRVMARKIGIDAERCTSVMLYENLIRLLDSGDGDVGIYAQGEDVTIERCDLQIIPTGKPPKNPEDGDDPDTPAPDPTDPCEDPQTFYGYLPYLVFYVDTMWGINTDYVRRPTPFQTLGGIQIGSGSERVFILENRVTGGAGNGITLGSDIADFDMTPSDPVNGDFEDVFFDHDFNEIKGMVQLDGSAIGGMTIFFEDSQGQVFSSPVAADGTFRMKLPRGRYRVYVSQTGLGILDVEFLGGGAYLFIVEKREQENAPFPLGGADLLAFIYTVRIEGNTITLMDENGISSPRFTSSDFAVLAGGLRTPSQGRSQLQMMLVVYILTGTITGFVVNLTITENTITRCLRNAPPLNNNGQFTLDRALGGIALSLVDGVIIDENVIEDCGAGAERPICGVFLAFAVDATVRDNHVLNNGQDTRLLDQAIDVTSVMTDPFTPTMDKSSGAGTVETRASTGSPNTINYMSLNQTEYAAFRQNEAMVNLETPIILELERGPRGGIVIPICFSANMFAGGTIPDTSKRMLKDNPATAASRRKKAGALGDVTDSARGRYAARIDGNTVVQPFGKALFLGAAGTVSITDNQFTSDQALERVIDAGAGGITGVLAAAMVLPMQDVPELNGDIIGGIDYFGSAVMVVNITPGAFVIDALKARITDVKDQGTGTLSNAAVTRIPFGFPDGNVLFVGNQIKQGDALARGTMVGIITMDDVNFSDNQVDVLNADNIFSTTALLGITVRSVNNRFKEPVHLTTSSQIPGTDRQLRRHSLIHFAISAGSMVTNQGHLCFLQFSSSSAPSLFANQSIFGNCGDEGATQADIPELYQQILPVLLAGVVRIASFLSQ